MKAIFSKISLLLSSNKVATRIIFWITGTGSLLWFLIRVIPKPSRAAYPCMKAAAPIMSGFVVYLLSLGGSVVAFRKVREKIAAARYLSASLFIIVTLISAVILFARNEFIARASKITGSDMVESTDSPSGTARGVHPGRVAWVRNPDVTNEGCSNTSNDYWYMDINTNQAITGKMLADGLKSLSGQENCIHSWDMLFRNFNFRHKKGWVGYQVGEKIVIKLNLTSLGNGVRKMSEGMNSTPQLALAILQQLIDTVGVSQSDITVGDPYRSFSDEYWDKCHSQYPNVHYIEGLGNDGREQTELTQENVYFNSDNRFRSRLPKAYVEASYMINMPCLKSHGSAGITLAAKNHQGSVIGSDQDPDNQGMGEYLHYDYPDNPDNRHMGMYRHLIDYMAHDYLGENTLVFIVDAIWSGRDWFGAVEKWQMAPFNNDWTSSLFLSQDAVAIESVGFDFLYNEFKNHSADHNNDVSPTWVGVQDYIHQAADPANWAAGIVYDPNHADHHVPVGSLGVHEHWNDAANMQYSQNLGLNQGIELITVPSDLVADSKIDVTAISVPATLDINSPTLITAEISPANATNPDVIWESSNTSLATVGPDGVITPLASGQVTITAMSADGNKRASTEVTIGVISGYHQAVIEKCTVYPNPVSEYITVNYALSERAVVQTEILAMDGRRIAGGTGITQSAGDNVYLMKLGEYNLANGMYICKVIAKGANTHIFTAHILVRR